MRAGIRFSSFQYLVGQGLRAMKKNRLMSMASIGVLTVCLLITGIASLFAFNVASLMGYLRGQNEVVVYLKEDLPEQALAATDAALRNIEGIRDMEYLSSADALERMKKSMGDYSDLWNDFEGEENPFLANYRVMLADITQLGSILPKLEALPNVEKVQAPVQLGEMFGSLQAGVSVVCLVLVVVLGFVSIVVISNTIRLTVFNRRNEISIMKYVGATNGFIRLPFFVEGVAVGLVAGSIAAALVLGGYAVLAGQVQNFTGVWGTLLAACLLPLATIALPFLLGFWLLGTLVGSVGTALAVRKYMNV